MRASPVPLRVPFLRLFVTVIGDDTGQTDDRPGEQRNTLLGKLCGLGCFPFSDSREGPSWTRRKSESWDLISSVEVMRTIMFVPRRDSSYPLDSVGDRVTARELGTVSNLGVVASRVFFRSPKLNRTRRWPVPFATSPRCLQSFFCLLESTCSLSASRRGGRSLAVS